MKDTVPANAGQRLKKFFIRHGAKISMLQEIKLNH